MEMPEYKYVPKEEARSKAYDYKPANDVDSILNKYSQKQKEDDILMLDVDEYLNKLQNDESQKTEDSTHNLETSQELTDRSIESKNKSSIEETSTLRGDSKRLGSASSKKTSLFGGKKNMKDFMKEKLAKTRQTGDNAVLLVGRYPISPISSK